MRAQCVPGARLASHDDTIGHIARLRACGRPGILAFDWLVRGSQRLESDLSSQKELCFGLPRPKTDRMKVWPVTVVLYTGRSVALWCTLHLGLG